MKNQNMINREVKLCEKMLLTIDECAVLSGIGEHRLRALCENPNNDFVVRLGRKNMIKREIFNDWVNEQSYI